MANSIKQYEQLTMIYLKDWDALRTTLSLDEIAKKLNQSEFLVIDWVGFSRYEVKTFKVYKPDDIEQYCLSQEKSKRDMLFWIINERKEKWLTTNWINHLLEIYDKRQWQK